MHEFLDAFDDWREVNGQLTDEEKAEIKAKRWNQWAARVRAQMRERDG